MNPDIGALTSTITAWSRDRYGLSLPEEAKVSLTPLTLGMDTTLGECGFPLLRVTFTALCLLQFTEQTLQ